MHTMGLNETILAVRELFGQRAEMRRHGCFEGTSRGCAIQ